MKLRLLNDPVLREPTVLVEKTELDYIKSLIPEMTKIMKYENGSGLAANQVGISKRFFIMKRGEEIDLIINPEIVEIGPLQKYNEGCLSIPGTSADTQRALSVKLKWHNEFFYECEQVFLDIEAVTIQHEVDHLDGKLYIDQLLPMRRLLTLDKHRKFLNTKGRKK